MKVTKTFLVLMSVCLTGLSAHAVDAQPSDNKDLQGKITGEIEDPPGAQLPKPDVSQNLEKKSDEKPTGKVDEDGALISDGTVKTRTDLNGKISPESKTETPMPMTRPDRNSDWGSRSGRNKDLRELGWPLWTPGTNLYKLNPERAQKLQSAMIAADITQIMEHACSARALRLEPALNRMSASALEERKTNPEKSLVAATFTRPDIEGDRWALQYHKAKCLAEYLEKKVGDDFKMSRLADKSDLRAQTVKKALIDLRDKLDVQYLNRAKDRCQSSALTEQMNCIQQVMNPSMEALALEHSIDALLTFSKSDMTLSDAKDNYLGQVRQMIAVARKAEVVQPHLAPASRSSDSHTVN